MIFTTFKKKRQKDFHKTFSLAVIEIVEISSVNIRVFLYETKYFNHRLIIKKKGKTSYTKRKDIYIFPVLGSWMRVGNLIVQLTCNHQCPNWTVQLKRDWTVTQDLSRQKLRIGGYRPHRKRPNHAPASRVTNSSSRLLQPKPTTRTNLVENKRQVSQWK